MKTTRKQLPRENEFVEIIQELIKVKHKYPDWRFGQILSKAIANDTNCNPDIVKTRDEELLEAIKKL